VEPNVNIPLNLPVPVTSKVACGETLFMPTLELTMSAVKKSVRNDKLVFFDMVQFFSFFISSDVPVFLLIG
jgi:hypothetical protein